MKPCLAISVFLLLLTASTIAGLDSLLSTRQRAQLDVDRALQLTLRRAMLTVLAQTPSASIAATFP